MVKLQTMNSKRPKILSLNAIIIERKKLTI